jgi:hypothetical protein
MTTPAKPNPLLELPAMAELLALPEPERRALAALLSELGTQAHTKAEVSWRQRKGPMAAYWRAVGVYAGHTARALRRGPVAQPLEGTVLAVASHSVPHPAGGLMCSECGAIEHHTRSCSASAQAVAL